MKQQQPQEQEENNNRKSVSQINFYIKPHQIELLRKASKLDGRSLSNFLTHYATTKAEEILTKNSSKEISYE